MGDIIGRKLDDQLVSKEEYQVINIDKENMAIECRNENKEVEKFYPEELYTKDEFIKKKQEDAREFHKLMGSVRF
jgi:hypothetical protein